MVKKTIKNIKIRNNNIIGTYALGLLGGSITTILKLHLSAIYAILTLLFVALLLFYSLKIFKKFLISYLFSESMKIQKKEIARFKPDIIVGASWGGAVRKKFFIICKQKIMILF